MILSLILIATFWPTNGAEMGHFAMPVIAGELGYQGSSVVIDLLFNDEQMNAANRSKIEGLKILTGVLVQATAYRYLIAHYQTDEEIGWARKGAYVWAGFRIPLGLARGYLWKHRDTRKAYAETLLRAKIFSETMIMDFMPDGTPFWRDVDLVEIK